MKQNANTIFSNDEHLTLGKWLLTRLDGQAIFSKAKNAKDLERLVLEYAKKKGSVGGLTIDEESSEGLLWVVFEDLFNEVNQYNKLKSEGVNFFFEPTI